MISDDQSFGDSCSAGIGSRGNHRHTNQDEKH